MNHDDDEARRVVDEFVNGKQPGWMPLIAVAAFVGLLLWVFVKFLWMLFK